MSAQVELKNVSLKFRRYERYSNGMKEAVMRWIREPRWYGAKKPQRSEFWGVKNVSLRLREGERLGIIGHNGAGKSSLLKLISRIYQPTVGSISVEGRLAPLIEIGAGFHPELTGRENAFLNGAIIGLPRKVVQNRLEDIFEFAELREFIDMPVKYYSTGMYMRLAFSLATEISPDILILDELYAGGDLAFIRKANERLDQFVERSKILILVAHNMDYIRRFCNRVLVMDHGEVRADMDVESGIDKYHQLTLGQPAAKTGAKTDGQTITQPDL
jgi:ABC-type polysaccharide/polyol phosphate transport system ATPase subunit